MTAVGFVSMRAPSQETHLIKGKPKPQETQSMKGSDNQGRVQTASVEAMICDMHGVVEAVLESDVAITSLLRKLAGTKEIPNFL